MTLTAKQISDLNKMNIAAQRASLGTLLSTIESTVVPISGGLEYGTHIITETESSASTILIATTIDDIDGWYVQINQSGSTVTEDAKITVQSGSSLKIEDGATTYVTSASQVISYFVF